MIGKTFGHYTVLRETTKRQNSRILMECVCVCGAIRLVVAGNLRSGNSTNCGCLRKGRTTHGMSDTPEYNTWCGMRSRCYDTSHEAYSDYGGRGITVCKRWRDSFEAFFADMGNRPEGTSLDRQNNNSNYTPKNCRWLEIPKQNLNQRSNVRLRFLGKTQTASEWSKELGINVRTIYTRVKAGRSPKECLSKTPLSKHPKAIV